MSLFCVCVCVCLCVCVCVSTFLFLFLRLETREVSHCTPFICLPIQKQTENVVKENLII